MNVKYDGFQWDKGNSDHCTKHGVSLAEIEFVLANMDFYIPDPHPEEPRKRTVGVTEDGRHVFVVFMFRELEGLWVLRPISARYMGGKEVEAYEQSRQT